ncbi:complement C1q tumor necrosis factor-related protein 2-like [Saccostrea echinata]|uniref:complement C1q tumor necrosis factor-related protein 2-like n=1 Tax=Saccostrea echinata TaxID=191078 RepID=UPI002A7ECC8E|nr:complement C1q tumor necrosis factor-related protein 2-like [Saccostrea echinata]
MKETPQQIINKYNNYRTICNGLGYQNLSCKADNKGAIAFHSTLSNDLENMRKQQTVIFDNVTLNEGKGYNKKTGVFTAPMEGVYTFSWTTMSKYSKYFVSEIVHDGKPIAYNHTDGRGAGGHNMSSTNANIKLKKGDKVWIRAHRDWGQFANGGNWCNFSGNKL